MTSALEFVEAIIAYEELRNREVVSVRLGTKTYAALRRELGAHCVYPLPPGPAYEGIAVRGYHVWCDSGMPEDSGEVIRRNP